MGACGAVPFLLSAGFLGLVLISIFAALSSWIAAACSPLLRLPFFSSPPHLERCHKSLPLVLVTGEIYPGGREFDTSNFSSSTSLCALPHSLPLLLRRLRLLAASLVLSSSWEGPAIDTILLAARPTPGKCDCLCPWVCTPLHSTRQEPVTWVPEPASWRVPRCQSAGLSRRIRLGGRSSLKIACSGVG